MKIGSGILPIALDTKCICLARRSFEVPHGNCFGVIGGMVKKGLTFEQGALLEMKEEVGYDGPITLYPAHIYKRPGFEYHNFIGTAPTEFPFLPESNFAFELKYISWVKYEVIIDLITQHSYEFHSGLVDLLQESKTLIESLLR